MFNYKQTLEAMRKERASMQAELEKLDLAISALSSVLDVATQGLKRRAQISQAQRSGQRKNAQKIQSAKPRPKISAQGLRNIVAAQKKRWAKVRAAAKAKPKVA
jgi:hypothetical protein